ncbi:DMT family transporter [Acidocella aminolytica]|uniref:Drug/metabolite transporter integral membrane protein n=1 Tax=Acidocella aminolytica 101 = DSM 11237 TaxID=1120923 RepID=A0A0D6PFA8_9PROT|nr:DMT family transporter [Acidocella aminolytica]GAN80435.1 drug/metabolite transporter integral membrane protein [Acidocella aminolytica 101 = DSM 11237]GBQ35761.1 drug/metabolite transporter superfamily permease [Acidocella aminolytica 101 = DSM 11237]SHE96576.1 EamA domain-containing membrane protein RarD [Acidocella aminolytica 101 = DSM 11237]
MTALPAPLKDQTLKGVLFAILSFAAFSFSDASVKLIKGALPPYESAFFGGVFALIVFPALLGPDDKLLDVFTTKSRKLWLLRFFALAFGVIGSVTAFTHLPMADAFALIFLQPSFVTLMSLLFLKERIGPWRWAAVIIGFAGVLVVLRPGYTPFSIGQVGALFAGVGGAVSVISFRAAGGHDKRISLFGAGTLGVIVIPGLLMLPNFRWPDEAQWGLLASYGLLAALANLLLMSATTRAPAAYVGPIQYSQMLWAILLGYLIFDNGVDGVTLVGASLIVGSGLLTLRRERMRGTPVPHAAAVRWHHAAFARLRGRG